MGIWSVKRNKWLINKKGDAHASPFPFFRSNQIPSPPEESPGLYLFSGNLSLLDHDTAADDFCE